MGKKQEALNYLLSSTGCATFAEAKATFLFLSFLGTKILPSSNEAVAVGSCKSMGLVGVETAKDDIQSCSVK